MTFERFSSVSASFCNCFYLNFINIQIFHVVFVLTALVILDFKVSEDLLMFSIYSGSGIYCLIEALARLLILLISYLTKGIECRPAHTCPRYTHGPLVPMVGLVPMEKDVIPMVLLVNMHLINGTLIIFPCDLAGYREISNGPLVPLVPIEKDVIPMVLMVNMHIIKGTLIIFPCDLAGYRAIPMVHWYQWYDWYQWKMMPFQWFYWCKTSSLLHQVKTR